MPIYFKVNFTGEKKRFGLIFRIDNDILNNITINKKIIVGSLGLLTFTVCGWKHSMNNLMYLLFQI